MAKDKPIKEDQHFVNQEYLRRFATPESTAQHPNNPKKWLLHVYDKVLKRTLPPQTTRKVAFGKFFYNARGQPETLEDQLAQLEGEAAVVHKKLLAIRDLAKLAASERETLAKFVAVQYVRTNQQRLLGKWVSTEQLVPLLLDPVRGREYVAHFGEEAETDEAGLDEIRLKMIAMLQQDDPDHQRDAHVYQMMVLAPLLLADIRSRVWQINESKTGRNLCTSDHPVLTIPTTDAGYRELHHALLTLGIPDIGKALREPGSCPSFRLVFPLSPRLALSLHPRGSVVDSYHELPELEVEMLNELQAIQSLRQIYSCDTDFTFVDRARLYHNRVRDHVNSFSPVALPDAFQP